MSTIKITISDTAITDGVTTVTKDSVKQLFSANHYVGNLPSGVTEIMYNGINSGKYADEFDHFWKEGMSAGWTPNKFYAEDTYLSNNSDLKDYIYGQRLSPDANKVRFNSALEHWVLYGRAEGVAGNVSRASSSTGGSFTFTTGVDAFVGDDFPVNTFTGTDSTYQVGDSANGGGAANTVSTLNLTLSGGNAPAVTVKNMDNIKVTASGGARTFDASLVDSGTSSISTYGSSSAVTVNSLAINPTFGMTNTGQDLTVNQLDSVLTGNTATLKTALDTVSAGTATFNNTATGNFKTVEVTSNGATANSLTSLAGTALVGADTLTVKGSQEVTIPVAAAVNTVKTLTVAPKATISFADSSTGNTNALTSTFSTAGSKLQLAATTYSASNKATFTGTGNTLAVDKDVAITTTDMSGTVTNGDILEVTNAVGANTIDMSKWCSTFKTVSLDAATTGATVINNLQNQSTVNLSKTGSNATANTVTTKFASGTANELTYNVLGTGTGGTVLNTLASNHANKVTFNVANTVHNGTVQVDMVTNPTDIYLKDIVVTGGNSGNLMDFTKGDTVALPTAVNTFNASGADVKVKVKGNTGSNTLKGGSATDTLDGGNGANTITLHATAGATDSNYVVLSDFSAATIVTDFNPGTSTTTVDQIQFKANPADNSYGANQFMLGDASNAGAAAASAATVTAMASTTTSLAAGNNLILYTGAATTASDISTVANTAGATGWALTFTNNLSGAMATAANGIPIAYLHTDGNVHVAGIRLTTGGGSSGAVNDASNAVTVEDLLILQGVTAMTNIDVNDFAFIA